ncbi:MAG: site-specific DNA-methyltransferase [Roseiarcus sp.]|uniref:DNA methyltransferase n=1 Tax=Roseiarcus sp. TaxID=1969460 RepID=UPI003C412CDB
MAKKPVETDVENYAHDNAKRINIPTAENQSLVPDDEKALKVLRYPRNPDLDPQLVWRGKDAEDDAPLEVAAPPIYVQEKIHPRALIEDLRKQSARRKNERAEQTDLFHDFNGLPEGWVEDAAASYYHDEGRWQNRMILGDSLLVMGSLAEREALRGKVQCIYFDPPYGIKFNSNWQPSTKSRDVKDGKEESVSREPEVVRAFRDTWKDEIHSYLSYLRDRLSIARDLLNETGSIFVQIGDENVHRVRAVMDEVFGDRNFVSMICLRKTGGQETSAIPNVADYILWYSKVARSLKSRQLYYRKSLGVGEGSGQRYDRVKLLNGIRRSLTHEERDNETSAPEGARAYQLTSLISSGVRTNTTAPWDFEGKHYHSGATSNWKTSLSGLKNLARAERIEARKTTIAYVRYIDDFAAYPLSNIWTDVAGAAGIIYVVQTSATIVQRCILMTTDPGDLVLEGPWGGDIRHGFVYERAPHVTLKSIANNAEIDVIWERRQPELEQLLSRLNAALKTQWEEWQVPREADPKWPEAATTDHAAWWALRRERQKEVDDSIARNADVETLYDRPLKAKRIVRVAGPFTVESLSPHRVLPLEEDPFLAELLGADEFPSPLAGEGSEVRGPATQAAAAANPSSGPSGHLLPQGEKGAQATDFAKVVYDNLLASGVQNTKKGEAIKFEWLKPRVSRSGLVPFEGRYTEAGELKRAAICIGPEYDTVGYDLVRKAAREAADLFDTLIVCGFAFAPEVDESRLNFGSLTVLKARMNQDLRMGDKLKASGAGNLFVIFGEPDLKVHPAGDGMIRVEIRGMDIFDPTTGEVRSSGGSDLKNDVAAWFIDDDYNEESFFVRQAYFVGQDPYESLKRALKAEIDETAWEEMSSTISRPFPKPASGRICVKVINHCGDEVQKVFQA